MLPRRQAGMLQLSEFHECLIEWSRKDIFIISGIKHALPHTFGCTSTTRCNYPIIKKIYKIPVWKMDMQLKNAQDRAIENCTWFKH
jgi:hypothetical protein